MLQPKERCHHCGRGIIDGNHYANDADIAQLKCDPLYKPMCGSTILRELRQLIPLPDGLPPVDKKLNQFDMFAQIQHEMIINVIEKDLEELTAKSINQLVTYKPIVYYEWHINNKNVKPYLGY